MKLRNFSDLNIVVILGCVLASCAPAPPPEPEGPAELIGKGIDQITRGIQESDSKSREDERSRRERRSRYGYDSETGYADQFPSEPLEAPKRGR